MKMMLSALMMGWAASTAAAECPNQATLTELRWMDRRVDRFQSGGYVRPESAAAVLHDIRRIEKEVDPSCLRSLTERLAQSRRRATDALKASLEADSFVLEGNIAILERKLEDLEQRVAAAETAGWPDGSRGALATEYVGYYQGQRPELLRMYINLAKAAFRAEEADDARPWVEETTCAAGKAIVGLSHRIRRLEDKLRVGYNMPAATPGLREIPPGTPRHRIEPKAGPIFGGLEDWAESKRQAEQAFR